MFIYDLRENLEEISFELNVLDQRQKNVFFEYVNIFEACYSLSEINNILEVGSGHSTPLFSMLAKDFDASFYSVDLNFERVKKAIRDTRFEQVVSNYCKMIKCLTVSGSEFMSFYEGDFLTSFMGKSISDLYKEIGHFILDSGDLRKLELISKQFNISPSINALRELVLTDNGIMNNDILRNNFSFDQSFVEETKFITSNEQTYHKIFNDEINSRDQWDVIFFDSGEFSSNIEFEKLAPKIRNGGLAIFHDISFPKSFKNFIPCSYVSSHPESWDIVYLDTKKTPQGLMVAKKLL